MVKDHEGSIKKIADFLGYGPYTDQEWADILELTSFSWMKKHEMKFEAKTIWEVPALMNGAMMRQGSFGLARKEGISEEVAKEIRGRGERVLTDETMLEWMYNGGDVDEVCGRAGVSADVVGAAKMLDGVVDCKCQACHCCFIWPENMISYHLSLSCMDYVMHTTKASPEAQDISQ